MSVCQSAVTVQIHQMAALFHVDQPRHCGTFPHHPKDILKQIIFRHKIFYLKHLVLTDIHYPTANLLAHSIYLEQEAIAKHCTTLLSITAADPKPPNPYKTSQKYRRQPAKYQNHIHFVLVTLTTWRHSYKCYQKQIVSRIYQHYLPYKTPTVIAAANMYCEMSKGRTFRAKLVSMSTDARGTRGCQCHDSRISCLASSRCSTVESDVTFDLKDGLCG